MDLHVLIAGGGIGGLCLAHGLRKLGIGVSVYERDTSRAERVDGYRLAINPAGSRSLRACLPEQLWERFVATAGKRGGGFAFLDSRLRELVVVEPEIMFAPDPDPAEADYPVDRGTLRGILLDGLDDVVEFGKRLVLYEIGADGRPVAHFADGSSASGDVLVGADGSNSRVRAQLLPQAQQRDLGAVGVGLKLPLTAATRGWLPPRLGSGMNLVLTGRPSFLFTSVFERPEPAGDDYLLCAFVARRDQLPVNPDRLPPGELQAAVTDLAAGWHPDLRRVLADCDPGSVAAFGFVAAERPAPWEPSTVTLLGDAIHTMPPAGGNGANTALRDARLLALELSAAARGERSVQAAIGRYESELRVYGFEAVDLALQTLRQGLASNPFALLGTKVWFRLCRASTALRRNTFGTSWARVTRHRAWELNGTSRPSP
jgi:2-polyprenyl-6-methoxyphenol hydroxylase-like FAD-dependent oxidoreductase